MTAEQGFSGTGRELSIREARVDDAADLCDLIRSSIVELCFLDHGGERGNLVVWLANKTADNIRAWIIQSHIFVAEHDGTLAGVAGLASDGTVILNYVRPKDRFTGVSKALLLAVEERARDLGLAACTVETTKTALPFYEAAGYVDLDRQPRKHG